MEIYIQRFLSNVSSLSPPDKTALLLGLYNVYHPAEGMSLSGYAMVWARDGLGTTWSGYELVLGKSWCGYELTHSLSNRFGRICCVTKLQPSKI